MLSPKNQVLDSVTLLQVSVTTNSPAQRVEGTIVTGTIKRPSEAPVYMALFQLIQVVI